MSLIQNAFNLLKGDLETDGIPVIVGALSILQKDGVNVVSLAAAKAYILGNAPAALLAAEQSFAQQELAALSNSLAAIKPAS